MSCVYIYIHIVYLTVKIFCLRVQLLSGVDGVENFQWSLENTFLYFSCLKCIISLDLGPISLVFQKVSIVCVYGLNRRHDGSLISDEFVCGRTVRSWSRRRTRHTEGQRKQMCWLGLSCAAIRLSSRWRTRLSSKLTTACWHVARQDVLSAANPSRSAGLIPMVLKLTLSASLYRLRCPPRERSPCCSWP